MACTMVGRHEVAESSSMNSFRCAKCHNLVEVESNLLLRSDGSPICENCSYNCHICQKPIVDEAIMTGKSASYYDFL